MDPSKTIQPPKKGVLLLCGLMGWEDAFFYAAALITATVFGFLARRAAVEQQAAAPIDETPQ